MKLFIPLFIIILSFNSFSQKTYKILMNDPSVNFYDVCKAAEKYFETHDKNAKGSGWKGYQRWKNENESKYAPSGQRDNVDPFLVSKAYERIKKQQTSRSLFTNGWVDLGPYSLDSLTGHYSAGLGRIETFDVNPLSQNEIYLGSRSGGFWKTNDGGVTWQGGSVDFLPACGVNTITTSPTNFDSVLINVRQGGNGTSHGIYRSTDGGASFQLTPFNPVNLGKGGLGSNWGINQIAYHPTIPNLVFVTATDGLYKSTDNLSTWTKVTSGSISEIEFHPSNPNTIYIYDYYYWGSNKNVVLISTDTGSSFTPSNTIVGNNDNTSVKMGVSPQCVSCVWFASGNGIWKSTNNGVDFNLVNAFTNGSQGFIIDDLDTTKMMSGYVDGFNSSDGGQTFNQNTWWSLGAAQHGGGGNQNAYQNSNVYIHADLRVAEAVNGNWYVGTDGMLSVSTDKGVTWTNVSNNIGVRENYLLGASQSNHYKNISGSQDNGTSIYTKDGWVEFYGADGMEALIHPLNDNWMIGNVQYGGKITTQNGGASLGFGGSPSGESGQGKAAWESPMFYNPNNQMMIYHCSDSLFVSNDFTQTWTKLGAPSFGGLIAEAEMAQNNDSIIVVSNGSNIEKSFDGGLTFFDIKNNLPAYTITDIAFDPNDDETIFVTYNRYQNDGQKIYMTTNGGTSWTNITYNIGDMPLRAVVMDHTPAGNIYVGGEIGVYTMPKGGTNWVLYNQDLPNVTVKELEVVRTTNTLRAATWGRGLWEYSLVGRENYPAIINTTITDLPTLSTPKETVEQFVTSTISYTSGTLSNVYVKWSVDSLSFDSTLAMINTVDSTWVSNGPLPLADSGQKVYFKVYAVGSSNDTTETYKFMYELHEFKYCVAAGSSTSGNLYINEFDLGNINNTSGNDSIKYYSDSVIYLVKDSSYNVFMQTNTGWSSNDHGAWIDYNGDANFTENEEILYSINNGSSSANLFTVPSYAKINDTVLLRARVSYWSNTTIDPCGITLGEVEEYPVYIIETPNLTYSLNDSTLCLGEDLSFSYTGDVIDSVRWTFSNGINIYNSNTLSGTLNSVPAGIYSVSIEGYLKGISFLKTYTNAFEVKANNIDTTVTNGGITLTANQTGVLYQWLDCGNSLTEITGETNQSYTPSNPGVFAVKLNDNYCIDTSSCHTVATVSLQENTLSQAIKVFPNPVKENVTITFGKQIKQGVVSIMDEAGKIVMQYNIQNNAQLELKMDKFATGVYYIDVVEGNSKATIKILKVK